MIVLTGTKPPASFLLPYVGRVYLVLITDDRRLLLTRRHVEDEPAFWAYPTADKVHPQVSAQVTAANIVRRHTGQDPRDLTLIGVLPATGLGRAAAVFTARTTWDTGQAATGAGERRGLHAIDLACQAWQNLDVRPVQVIALLDGPDPVSRALDLPDLSDPAVRGEGRAGERQHGNGDA